MGGDGRIGVALDFSKSSKLALQWAIDNVAGVEDTLFVIHFGPCQGQESKHQLWLDTGSPLIPLLEFRQAQILEQYGLPENLEVVEMLDIASASKQAKIVAKLYWEDARENLVDAVQDLKIDSLVMGSRGLGRLKRVLLGSVTNYVLSTAPSPVTVIKYQASSFEQNLKGHLAFPLWWLMTLLRTKSACIYIN